MYFLGGLVISKKMYLNFSVLDGKIFCTFKVLWCELAKAREVLRCCYVRVGRSSCLREQNLYLHNFHFRVSQTSILARNAVVCKYVLRRENKYYFAVFRTECEHVAFKRV